MNSRDEKRVDFAVFHLPEETQGFSYVIDFGIVLRVALGQSRYTEQVIMVYKEGLASGIITFTKSHRWPNINLVFCLIPVQCCGEPVEQWLSRSAHLIRFTVQVHRDLWKASLVLCQEAHGNYCMLNPVRVQLSLACWLDCAFPSQSDRHQIHLQPSASHRRAEYKLRWTVSNQTWLPAGSTLALS